MSGWQYTLVEYLEKFIDFGLPVLMFLVSPFLIYVGVRSFKKPLGPVCPKCKYDMRGITGLSCPECGYTVKTAGELSRPRRRWVMLTLGLLMFLLSVSAGVLMLSTMLEAKRAAKIVAQVQSQSFARLSCFGSKLPHEPLAWAVWVANHIAGDVPPAFGIDPSTQNLTVAPPPCGVVTQRAWLAHKLLKYSQPTWIYYSHWDVRILTDGVLISKVTPSELQLIGQCSDIKDFTLYVSQNTDLKANDFAAFKSLRRLEGVDINDYYVLPAGAYKSIFHDKSKLTTVYLSTYKNADEALIEIGAGSPRIRTLKHSIPGERWEYMPDPLESGITDAGFAALNSCTELDELKLRITNLTPQSLGFLSSMKALRYLDLSVVNTEQITAEHFDAIGRVTSLRDLSFTFKLPAGEKPQGLLRGLSGLTNLDLLHMHLNQLNENDFDFLKSTTSLQTLYISGYGADGSGLRVLENHPNLKTFTLRSAPNLKPEHKAFLLNLKNVKVTID